MSGEYAYRTLVTRLEVTEDQRASLETTIDAWCRACQIATDRAWERGRCHQYGEVQSTAYDAIREQTNLGSQHAILATRAATDAIEGCVERLENGRNASKPEFTAPTITYDDRSMTLFDDGTVSLATTGDRVRCALALPDDADDSDGYQHESLDGSWEVTESTLTFRDGSLYLHIGVRRPIETDSGVTAGDGAVLGVDSGVENVAVTSTARFFDGGELRHRIEEYERTRAGLEQTGTSSARETIVRRSGRQRRYVRDVLHRVANGIIEEARRFDCSVIAVEDLEGIREEVEDAGWFHRWAYRRLRSFLEYRTELTDIEVVAVESRDTSTRCADCGHVSSYNRLSRGEFHCQRCGTRANADYNAAKNIALQHVRRDRQSSRRTGAGHCAL